MPTITVNRADLEHLLGRPAPNEQLHHWLTWVKGELKDEHAESDDLRVELQDSNRPDLWSTEGIARQIRCKLGSPRAAYPFFELGTHPSRRLIVAPQVERVRPYIAACTASGYRVTEAGLAQLIQTQEKLAEIFGRKRRTVSIGFYRLAAITFPVFYDLAGQDEIRFTPLGFETPLTAREILTGHPKGLEYGNVLAGQERVPLLRDQSGQVLSMPPIINSRDIGEVRVGDHELLVEVTGTDQIMVVLTLNILAVNLADRGAHVEPVAVEYPYDTPLGKSMVTPQDLGKPRAIPVAFIETALGQRLGAAKVREAMTSYGCQATMHGQSVSVKLPPYRNDFMHAVDVVEDVAISCGYGEFSPVMPGQFTVGGLSRLEELSDRVRDLIIGLGFQEVVSNIMASRQDVIDRMRLGGTAWDRLVEVDNVMSQQYSCLRSSMLPSLLRVEAASSRAFYPHQIFEVGEAALADAEAETGSRTVLLLGALLAHPGATFSAAHSCLDFLFYHLDQAYTLEAVSHPSFLEGRAGSILCDGRAIGLIGELHPEVLERWEIAVPTAAFEVRLDDLLGEWQVTGDK
jgi:phenylalanyl-tRNA synthetase beta chain